MKTTTLVVLALLLASISIVTLAQQTPAPAPAPAYIQVRAAIPHGTLQSVAYKSKSLGTDRKMMVYTPPGYEQSSGKYPLLYLLHGAGTDETSWTRSGKADVILDNLLADTARINSQLKFLWVSCGTEDTLFNSIAEFSTQLAKHKIEHIYRITGGAHSYPVWQRNLNEVAPLLFQE